MNKEDLNKKHYSLAVIFSLFIVIMASFVIYTIIDKNGKNTLQEKLEQVGYNSIESINPLVIEKSNQELDKTSSNVELSEEIKRVYNIDVIYGRGTEYLTKTVNADAIYDSSEINTTLIEIINCLEKYPNNIFKEIELKDYNIEICLVDYFNNDNVALATRDSNNNFKIFLSYNGKKDKFHRAIHHETYHVLEYYMKLEYDINQLYKSWTEYNPEGFVYNDNIEMLDSNYVYNLDKQGRAYFVSAYSKVSDKEDRAEVFADTMISSTIPGYYTDSIGAIKNKMKLITDVLNHCFYSAEYNHNLYWKRYF